MISIWAWNGRIRSSEGVGNSYLDSVPNRDDFVFLSKTNFPWPSSHTAGEGGGGGYVLYQSDKNMDLRFLDALKDA